jgi:hypothetical protein
MCLGNVNNVKRDLILVLLVQLVERGNLPAKRRSSIAAKNEDYGTRIAKG